MTNVLRKKWIKRIESISVYEERLLFTLNAIAPVHREQ